MMAQTLGGVSQNYAYIGEELQIVPKLGVVVGMVTQKLGVTLVQGVRAREVTPPKVSQTAGSSTGAISSTLCW